MIPNTFFISSIVTDSTFRVPWFFLRSFVQTSLSGKCKGKKNELGQEKSSWGATEIFCTLGTTIKSHE